MWQTGGWGGLSFAAKHNNGGVAVQGTSAMPLSRAAVSAMPLSRGKRPWGGCPGRMCCLKVAMPLCHAMPLSSPAVAHPGSIFYRPECAMFSAVVALISLTLERAV